MKLEEGKIFPFQIARKISLDDSEEYFVLIDPMGYKILMPAGFYSDYGFKNGHVVNCRIDKVNCNGQVFLEPEHPFYKENQIYEFEVADSGIRTNLLDEKECFFVVKDCFNNKWTIVSSCEIGSSFINTEKITCRIDRIKKGKLFLRLSIESDIYSKLKTGEEYDFMVLDTKIHPDDKLEYFVLKGPDNIKHLLRKKYYHHYGIKINTVIRCKVVKFTSEGYFFLEPQNPYYHIGKTYDFKVKRFEELIYSDGLTQKQVVLEDSFKEENIVLIDEDEFMRYKGEETLKAKVSNIRKSRLELQLI